MGTFKKIRFDIGAWLFLIAWETVAVWLFFGVRSTFSAYIGHYLVTIGVFYFVAIKVIPITTSKLGVLASIVISILCFFILFLTLHHIIDLIIIRIEVANLERYSGFSKNFILATLYRGLFIYGICYGYYFLKNYLRVRDEQMLTLLEKQTLDKNLAITQNLYLKAQINPHFLFNVLHFVNYQIGISADTAREAVGRLSNIMHFAFSSEDSGEFIRLGDELEQVEELIGLQELRGERFSGLSLDYELAVCEFRIIPLVLLTLVENIYKHGDLSEPAVLSVVLEEEGLVVSSSNKVGGVASVSDRTGMGNIAERLRAAYGDAFVFEYGVVGERFSVRLVLPYAAVQAV